MSSGLKWLLGILLVLLLLPVVLVILVRFHDGPMEIVAGGPFRSGELVTEVEDWSFLNDIYTLEMETKKTGKSRVLWVAVHENQVYIFSNYMNSRWGRIWKRWPRNLMGNDEITLRVDGKLYALYINRLQGEAHIPAVLQRFNDKYKPADKLTPESVASGKIWLFTLTQK